jgi:two-component system sensor histidine kinase SenX3
MWLAIVVSLSIGGMIGFVVARRVDRSTVPAQPEAPPRAEAVDDLGSVLRTAADQLDLGVVVADSSGSVIYRNRAAMAMNGTHVGVIIEDHIGRALAAARDGERIDDLVELHGPPRVALQLVAEPMPGGYAVGTVEDVSERTRINMMRTDFVANISHELKTPVGAIAVLGEALFGETDVAVIERVAGRMVGEARRAVDAIDDLLELSRIESGPLLEEVVELDDVVAAAIARGRVVDESKGVTVTSFDGHPNVKLRADSRQLVAALGNLVENAVKYSDADGVVQVRTRIDERAIEVMVADHGIGIPARDLERIFERFYRVDRARSRTTGGTGLGLSIVRHVASNHGGEVLVSSQEGEGSTFVLRLPISLVVAAPSVDSSTDAHEPTTPSTPSPHESHR